MQHDSKLFIRLGLIINLIALVAAVGLIIRAFQPAVATVLHGPVALMDGARMGGMGMGSGMGMGRGNGMGMGNGMAGNGAMRTFHQAEIPADYVGLTNPVAADAASIARGAEAYALFCVSCHGESGMGDGVAGQALDPAPAAIAQTSQMLGDDYLFWRISEGGSHFETAMPAWDGALDEQVRWDLINYVQSLGSGMTGMGPGNGRNADPAAEAAMHDAMVAGGVEQGLITTAEGETFLAVHAALDAYMATNPVETGSGPLMNQQPAMLAAMVEAGTLTQADADTFITVRDTLLGAGLMQ
jgi:mono/diheme cytochrome c family protein